MSLLTTAAQLLSQQLREQGQGLDPATAVSGLQQLLPMAGGDIDLAALAAKFTAGQGLAGLAGGFLGQTGGIDIKAIIAALGEGQLASVAQSFGLNSSVLTSALATVLPQLLQKASGEGAGALAADAAKSMFGKFFS